MKKILISGSSGFVGSRVLHQWQGLSLIHI